MRADFEMFVRVFVDECRPPDSKPFDPSWQGNRTYYPGPGALCRLNDSLGRLVQDSVIVGFEADAYLLFGHNSPIEGSS
jgi:hypothetical protein